ncbi:Peroxin-3 [Saitoella complicata NRRL Y-17804]|nr:Peroxin-3 [Saitoella complicata NRRL Y-17804]ODQ50351.1 Peroxin-3 [Saitoella complicata NRRL Y-17804]
MFQSIRGFLSRHRRAIGVTTVVASAAYLATQYVSSKIKEVQERAMGERTAKENLRRRFEQNQQDCTFTLLALFPSLAEQVSHELDVEGITADLQRKKAPSKAAEGDEAGSMISGMSEVAGDGNGRSKAELWNDLKILSITRTLTLIYCLVLLTVLTRVQLNIIGRGTYVASVVSLWSPVLNNEVRIEEEDGDERTDLERDYLSFSWWLIHNGWKGLSAKVKTAVEELIGGMSLKEELSLAQFDLIISRIRAIVEKESFLQFLLPLTPGEEAQVLQQFTDRDGSCDADGAEGIILPSLPLRHLIDETHDFLSSPDAVIVINQLLNAGVHTLIENMAAAIYPSEPSVDNTDILQRRVRLASMLPVITREAKRIEQAKEYAREMEAGSDGLVRFSAIVYSSYDKGRLAAADGLNGYSEEN